LEVLSLIQRLPRSASPKVIDGFVDRIQPSSHIPSDVVEPSVLGIHDVQAGCGGVIRQMVVDFIEEFVGYGGVRGRSRSAS
jgi:hypothetical protein